LTGHVDRTGIGQEDRIESRQDKKKEREEDIMAEAESGQTDILTRTTTTSHKRPMPVDKWAFTR
jgi:hypothetical protein